jgi:hypothetical protein
MMDAHDINAESIFSRKLIKKSHTSNMELRALLASLDKSSSTTLSRQE